VESARNELARIIAVNQDILTEKRKIVQGLRRTYALMEAHYAEATELNSRKRAEEIDFFKNINNQLKVREMKSTEIPFLIHLCLKLILMYFI
jgi:hypothetical protein